MRLILITIVALVFSSCSTIRDSMAFHPDKKSKIPTKNLPPYFHDLTIKTSDDERLKAFHLKHDETIAKRLVVYFHGNAGNLYHRVEWINQLYLKGINVLIIDYRGYGGSTGSPSESGVYIDGKAAIEYAIDSLGYSEDNINVMGRSIGTTVAIEVSQNRKFESLTLITPLTTGREMGDVVAPSIASVAMDSFDSRSKIKNIISPTMIIHGDLDRTIPITMGYDLYNRLKVVEKEFIEIKGGGHNDLQDVNPYMFWGNMFKFLKL